MTPNHRSARRLFKATCVSSPWLFIIATLFVAPATGASQPAWAPWSLGTAADAASSPAVDAVHLQLAPAALEGDTLVQAPRLRLPLLGSEVTALRTGGESRLDGGVWRGRVETTNARVVLTVKNGLLAGAVYGPDQVHEILTERGEDGPVQVLRRLRSELFPPCAGGLEPTSQPADAEPATRVGTPPAAVDPVSAIGVMGVYSSAARSAAGGVAAIETTIQAAVDAGNTAFIDSDMDARFVLVHTFEAPFAESGDMFVDLPAVASDATVAARRDQYAADMVALIVEDGGGFCGLGYVMRTVSPGFASSAFQVTDRGCAVGNLSYIHEHGHNMGFEHDPANGTSPGSASYPWSFGHFHSGSYRTVMSYSNQCQGACTRVPHFSNPDITHNGLATGIAEERDNARSGDSTAPVVTDFRTGALFADGFESGTTSNWGVVVP